MKKYLLIIILHLSLTTFSYAQNPLVKQWDKRFGGNNVEVLNSFLQSNDGGFILGGYSASDSSGDKSQRNWDTINLSHDYWIVKTDSAGNKQWEKRFGGIGFDQLFCMQQAADGGYLLGGWSDSDSSGDKSQPSRGLRDYWIVKIDSVGNMQWDKRFGGIWSEEMMAMQRTIDNGFILAGTSGSDSCEDKSQDSWHDSVGVGTYDYWIIKIDSVGNKQWDKRFGGRLEDRLISLLQTIDNGFILGGYSYSDSSGDKTQSNWDVAHHTYDYWIVKIDSNGNKQWDKSFGGNNYDKLFTVNQTFDAGYIIGGCSVSGINGDKTQPLWGGPDYWIIKVDSLGNKEWDKDIGGSASEDEVGSITQMTDKGYLIAGASYSPISGDKTEGNLGPEQTWIVKIDSLGNKQWDKTIFTAGHDEQGYLIQLNDSCYVIANFTTSGIGGYKTQDCRGAWDYWIVKFCETTLQVPVISLASSDTIMCEKQCINFFDLSTNTPSSWQWYFPGASPDTSTQQNPTNICYNLYGNYNVALVACNAAGCDSIFFPAFINVLPTPPAPVITVSNDTLFASGPYSFAWYEVSNPTVVLGTDSFFVFTTLGSYYVIVTDSNGCGVVSNVVNTSVQSLISNQQFSITPNPASDELTVINALNHEGEIRIINTLGETVLGFELQAASHKLNISALPDGIYFLQFNSGAQHFNCKFVVQR
ncbi:MAG: T9SS type A sorting domain-containing protein [Bacteroidia bacterium]